tara:strand:+ start:20379 stop:20591 length:213 start_codon:yes stop_codon:yes gene_type:complete
MDTEQALNVLEQALNLANNKGAFNLKDATVIQQSLDIVQTLVDQQSEAKTPSAAHIADYKKDNPINNKER